MRRALLLVLGAAIGVLLFVGAARSAGRRVGECVRNAMVLSQMSEVVRVLLYRDTDSFLAGGGTLSALRPEAARTLSQIDDVARSNARTLSSVFFRESASAAREMLLAAEQQRNLAVEPRGTWMTYMSETGRAKGDFEKASDRYRLSRSSWISGDEEGTVRAEVTRQTTLLSEAMKRETERLEAESAKKKADFEKWDRETAARIRAMVPAPAEPPPDAETAPAREVGADDFKWEWVDTGNSMTAGGHTRRAMILRYRNTTAWTIYRVRVTFQDWQEEVGTLHTARPGVAYVEKVWTDRLDPLPRPIFSGSFLP